MPTVLHHGPYRFWFWSSDVAEPPHVHVERGGAEAKIWLDPPRVARNYRFPVRELSRILRVVENHRLYLLERWHDHFQE